MFIKGNCCNQMSLRSILFFGWNGAARWKQNYDRTAKKIGKVLFLFLNMGLVVGSFLRNNESLKGYFGSWFDTGHSLPHCAGKCQRLLGDFCSTNVQRFDSYWLHSVRINVVKCSLPFSANCVAMTFRSSSLVSLFRMDSLALILCRTAILNCNILLSDWFRK